MQPTLFQRVALTPGAPSVRIVPSARQGRRVVVVNLSPLFGAGIWISSEPNEASPFPGQVGVPLFAVQLLPGAGSQAFDVATDEALFAASAGGAVAILGLIVSEAVVDCCDFA